MSFADLTFKKELPNFDVEEISNVVVSLIYRCGMVCPAVEYNWEFDAVCREDAIRRGYPMDGPNSLARFIPIGVVMATTAYAHLTNQSTRVFISLYTTSLLYIDDVVQHDIDVVRGFNERFSLGKPHDNLVLDCFATLLSQLPKYFNRVGCDLIRTATLNLMTAMSLEYGSNVITITAGTPSHLGFERILSGATEAYAVFVFPPDVAVPTFVQTIPELMKYISNGNDILSFYKEEVAGESGNYISLLAAQGHLSKLEALWHVADIVVDAHNRVFEILKFQMTALDAYREFASGYLGFYAGLPQYNLRKLIGFNIEPAARAPAHESRPTLYVDIVGIVSEISCT